jgi:hypothetical protein
MNITRIALCIDDENCENIELDLRNKIPEISGKLHNLKDLVDNPIENALVENISDGIKTHWLFAKINKKCLGTGEKTSCNAKLKKKIRHRGEISLDGEPLDDCGHIVAALYGGKMVEFNLFPQNKFINRGWNGYGILWRRGVELLIHAWVRNPLLNNPRVEFQALLDYSNNLKYPHRPSTLKFVVIFICENDKYTEVFTENELENDGYLLFVKELANKLSKEEFDANEYVEKNYSSFKLVYLKNMNRLAIDLCNQLREYCGLDRLVLNHVCSSQNHLAFMPKQLAKSS